MADGNLLRRLRGAIGNGLVWGGGWSALWILAVVGRTLLGMLGILPILPWEHALGAAVRFGVAFGVIGFVTGSALSAFFGLLYRGRRLSEMSWVRVGIGGAVLAGLFVPVFLQTMSLLSGDGLMPWHVLGTDALWTALFGGVVAGGSIKLAQRADTLLPEGSDRPRIPGGAEPVDGGLTLGGG